MVDNNIELINALPPVSWTVESVDEYTGEVVVNFTNNIKTNKIKYIWTGSQETLEESIKQDALQMAHAWACSPISSGIKSQIQTLSGSISTDGTTVLDDGNLHNYLNPDII